MESDRCSVSRPLTLAPIDRQLIDVALLTPQELDQLNTYHARVLAEIGPELRCACLVGDSLCAGREVGGNGTLASKRSFLAHEHTMVVRSYELLGFRRPPASHSHGGGLVDLPTGHATLQHNLVRLLSGS